MYVSIFDNELLHACAHHQPEIWVAFRLGRNELQEVYLWNHRDIRELRFQAMEIGESYSSPGGLHR